MTRVLLAKTAGFCFGVDQAVKTLEKQVGESKGEVYTLGAIIHNPQIVEDFARRGVKIAETVQDVPQGATVVIRAHGVGAAVYSELQEKKCRVVDATCPFVKKIHSLVLQADEKGHTVLIAGDKEHPEVQGICGHIKNSPFYVFSSEAELEEIAQKIHQTGNPFVQVVSQTTFHSKKFKKCQEKIKILFENSHFYDTICFATEQRQAEAASLAKKCDAVIVVGGRKSSNTNKLFQICSGICQNTYLVESANEIPAEIHNFATVGITAGASTPCRVIEEVKQTMSEEMKTVTETGEMSFEEMLEQSCKTITTGERIKGVVVGVTPTEVKVELGAKQTGFITKDNFSADSNIDLMTAVNIGDEIEGIVLRVNDIEGTIAVSKKKVDAMAGFDQVEKLYESKETAQGVVTDINAGGLTVTVCGVRVFVPMSLTGKARDFDFSTMRGETVELNIVEFGSNRGRKKIIGSMKAVAYAKRKEAQEAFWSSVEVGQTRTGVIRSEKSITNFGVFVDLGGVDGLVHITELSWKKIKHPSEVVSVGDTLEVYIKDLDVENKKVSLGYKKAEDNPFTIFTSQYNVGDVCKAKIVSLMPFGAFARVMDGVDGLIHISQLADRRIAKPADVVAVGDEVDVKIVEIDSEKGKVGLSIRALIEPKEEEAPAEDTADVVEVDIEAVAEATAE